MASLVAGYLFGASETVTNAKLASLVNDGTVTGVTQADIASGEGLVKVATSAPSDTDQLWIDTNSTPVIARIYNSSLSAWVPVSEHALYTNTSGQTGSLGRVVILDTGNSNSYTYTSTSGDTKFLGIETGSISNGSSAPVISHGIATVLLTVSASAGCYLRSSTATGKADPVVNTAAGVFGFLTQAGTASGRAHIFGIDPNGTLDQTASYTWTGTHTFNGNVTLNSASGNQTGWTPIVQIVNAQTGAVATGSTTIPNDDTIPQSSEGTQFMSASITPKNAANKLLIDVIANIASADGGLTYITALFQDSTADALAASYDNEPTNDAGNPFTVTLRHYMAAGTTSSTTFKVRIGPETASTVTFNGSGAARKMGGVMASSITITEIKV